MINPDDYEKAVEGYFNFLVTEYRFEIIEKDIKGNVFYDIRYKHSNDLAISVSYENVEDYLQVIIYLLKDGNFPDYDDNDRRLHIKDLRLKVFSTIGKNEVEQNNLLFSRFNANNEIERKLLKSAKEIRLCLKYLNLI